MDAGLARARFDEADAALGFSLSKIIAGGPEEELQKTAFTQPAILTVSLAMADAQEAPADVAAGHSLGEYSALVYAGALEFADAVRLVHARGRFMQEAVPLGVGAMAAIIGLDASTVRDTCLEASPDESDACQPANFNGAGQVVQCRDTRARSSGRWLAGQNAKGRQAGQWRCRGVGAVPFAADGAGWRRSWRRSWSASIRLSPLRGSSGVRQRDGRSPTQDPARREASCWSSR